VVVDEAVLALSSYKTPNPLDGFYPQRDPGARESFRAGPPGEGVR